MKYGLYSDRVLPEEHDEALRLHRAVKMELGLQEFESELFGASLVLATLKRKRLDRYCRDQERKAHLRAVCDQVQRFELRWTPEAVATSLQPVHPDIRAVILENMKANIMKRGLLPEHDLPILERLFRQMDKGLSLVGLNIILFYEAAKNDLVSTNPKDDDIKIKVLEAIDRAIENEDGKSVLEMMSDTEALGASALLPENIAARICLTDRRIIRHLLGELDLLERYRRVKKVGPLNICSTVNRFCFTAKSPFPQV